MPTGTTPDEASAPALEDRGRGPKSILQALGELEDSRALPFTIFS